MKHIIFGESHGSAIGVVLENVPAGVELDMDFIRSELARRAPGRNALSPGPATQTTPAISTPRAAATTGAAGTSPAA